MANKNGQNKQENPSDEGALKPSASALSSSNAAPDQKCCAQTERVVLLHGATGTYNDMAALERSLVLQGYDVHNWDYPSTSLPIKDCAENIVQRHLSDEFNASTQKTHFVGFSMGGLVVEEIVKNHRPHCLGRIVTIGTPYQGSDVADFMKSKLLYRKYFDMTFGPAGHELTTAFRQAVMQNIKPLDYELGSIGGDVNKAYFVARHLFNGRANDGRVALDATKHPYMKEHAVVHADHIGLVSHSDSHEYTLNFIQFGSFMRPNP